jgi:hypothetical protein
MLAVADKCVKSLQESKPQKDEDGKIIPLTIEPFRNAYDEMWRNGKGYVDKMYRYKVFCEDRFKNWNSVVRTLLPEAQKFPTEPLTAETLPEVLMSYIGIPRVMGEQPDNMVKYMKNYQSALVKKLTSTKLWMANPGLQPDGTINFSPCTAPLCCIGSEPLPCTLRSHHESGIGVSVQVELPIGQTVTACRISDEAGSMTIHRGVSVAGPYETACRTQMHVQLEDYPHYLRTALGCHQVFAFEDISDRLRKIAELFGLKIL